MSERDGKKRLVNILHGNSKLTAWFLGFFALQSQINLNSSPRGSHIPRKYLLPEKELGVLPETSPKGEVSKVVKYFEPSI